MDQNQNANRRGCRLPLVMAYVPWQEWEEPWEEERGLERGTIFKDLYYPFKGREVLDR